MVTVGALTLAFIIMILFLIANRMLLPGIVMLGSFILFVLWITGLIETAIIDFGPTNVNANCGSYVMGTPSTGVSVDTLAWLALINICKFLEELWPK